MLKIMEKEKVLKAHPKRHVTLRENKLRVTLNFSWQTMKGSRATSLRY